MVRGVKGQEVDAGRDLARIPGQVVAARLHHTARHRRHHPARDIADFELDRALLSKLEANARGFAQRIRECAG